MPATNTRATTEKQSAAEARCVCRLEVRLSKRRSSLVVGCCDAVPIRLTSTGTKLMPGTLEETIVLEMRAGFFQLQGKRQPYSVCPVFCSVIAQGRGM